MFQRVGPKAFKKDLNNIIRLCEYLEDPQDRFKSIHIAGTNGKGSTAHGLSAIFQAHGYKTGLYTSPHYKDFRERIKINGKLIPKNEVRMFVEKHEAFFEALKPSFFEISVALAFYYFAKKKVDIAIIETGLGGRLDSTNIIHPEISVITNISFDHTNFLGNTLPLIAGEKAGIIKSNTPVVIGETHSETEKVFIQKAKEKKSSIYFADQILSFKNVETGLQKTTLDIYKNEEIIFKKIASGLTGPFQEKNIITILQTIAVLEEKKDYAFQRKLIKKGLKKVKFLSRFIGRWHLLSKTKEKPVVIADSAHNVAGLTYTLNHLKTLSYRHLHIVLGMVKDKDISKMLALLPKEAIYYFCMADIPRGMDAITLQSKAQSYHLQGNVYPSVKKAFETAQKNAHSEDIVYVGGSTFTVAEVL